MNIEISPSSISGTVCAPPSKSEAHRLIILSCIAGKRTTVYNIGHSKDLLTTLSCLKEMGASFKVNKGNLKVLSFKKKPTATLNCADSASTLRFLLPVCSALGIKATFTGSKRLMSRPIKPLITELNNHGAKIKNLTVNGKINSGKYKIDGNISSGFASGLILALSLLKDKSVVTVTGKRVSKNYVNLTVYVAKKFGVKIKRFFNKIYINSKNFSSPKSTKVCGDYSSGAFMLSLGALCGDITVKGLDKHSLQGDKKIIKILKKYGAKIIAKNNGVKVIAGKRKPLKVNLMNNPDLAQIVAVLGAKAKGKTILKNIERLKYKESDRVKAICEMLKTANVKYKLSGENLTVYGGNATGGVFNSYGDHRSSMACIVLSTSLNGKSKVLNADCVDKSYPEFFNDIKKIGGKTNVCL